MAADAGRCGVVVLAAAGRERRGEAFAAELARRGHPVAHVAPALLPGAAAWHALPDDEPGSGVRHVALPSAAAAHADADWSPADIRRASDALAAAIEALGLRCPVLVVQTAGWRHVAMVLCERTDFPLVCDLAPTDAPGVGDLLRAADLVLAPSGPAAERLAGHDGPVIVVPDGCDAPAPAPASAPVARLRPPLSGPLIGYAGDGPVDAGLLTALAELRPGWTFTLLTRPAAEDLARLDRLGNVYVLPSVPVAQRAAYVAEFDVGLVPLRIDGPALDRFPAEALELLAAGRPVVATAHPDLFALQPDGVTVGATAVELAAAIERALDGTHDAGPGVAAAAAASWSARVERFAQALDATLPTLDVVVVSYDNAEALGHCLRSIERDRSHPAHLIVVDNGSGDATLAVLEEAAADATVDRLGVNVGFPAAVNHGVSLGDGRYVLVLNDDVQLPAGGLLALVHGLARSRAVGLVGPVTNRVANEARVPVAYAERHPPAAVVDAAHAERAASHAGAVMDVRVAALFAAIIRRADLEAVGGLSERYQLGQFDDDDLSHRVRALLGLRVVCSDDVFVHHAGMSAFGALDPHLLDGLFSRNRRVFEQANRTTWQPHRLRDAPSDDPSQTEEADMQEGTPQTNGRFARTADPGVYEMLLTLERERQEAQAALDAEVERRVAAEAERDTLEVQLHEAREWAEVLDARSRTLEASLAWRIGRKVLDTPKRLPGVGRVARRLGATH